jgi:hypothetical protein
MTRIALFLALCLSADVAVAENGASGNSTMYLIRMTVTDAVATAEGGEKTKVIASLQVGTVENREAVFQVGGQTKVADDSIRWGTWLKVKVKKMDGNKVRVSGMLEVSNIAEPSDDFVERTATEHHFARTISLTETVCLGKRQTAAGCRTVELTCHEIEALEVVGTSPMKVQVGQ